MGGRYKTFDATGVDPNGKLYAGDMNAIEDMKADSVNLAQTIDLGTVRIGEAGLTLSRFGAGEAVLAGDMRVNKILRGLEGIIPGAFTTAQRDALGAGRAPYGIAILNTTKNIWEWNSNNDAARVWAPFGVTSQVGLLAARPAANSVVPGSTYFATDQITEYVSDGSTWLRKGAPAGATVAWFAAAAPTGWVKYDGSNLPSSTGIYADLSTHLGGVATPDTRGRVVVGQGTHADVDVVKDADSDPIGSRRVRHRHNVVQPTISAPAINRTGDVGVSISRYGGNPDNGPAVGAGNLGTFLETSASGVSVTQPTFALASAPVATSGSVGPQTGAEPTDGSSWITGLYIAKL